MKSKINCALTGFNQFLMALIKNQIYRYISETTLLRMIKLIKIDRATSVSVLNILNKDYLLMTLNEPFEGLMQNKLKSNVDKSARQFDKKFII